MKTLAQETARFMKHVREDGSNGCWIWLCHSDRDGYGRFRLFGRFTASHRASYEMFIGAIPEGLSIDHLCRNRSCVNPSHLEPVTKAENDRRGAMSRRHCPNGHEYTPENTRIRARSSARCCKICDRKRARAYAVRQARSFRCEVIA